MHNSQYQEYEWNETKREVNLMKHRVDFSEANLTKHRVDFSAVRSFDWETARVCQGKSDIELRWVAHGYIGHRLHVLVFTERRDRVRVISLRKANEKEIEAYAQAKARDNLADS